MVALRKEFSVKLGVSRSDTTVTETTIERTGWWIFATETEVNKRTLEYAGFNAFTGAEWRYTDNNQRPDIDDELDINDACQDAARYPRRAKD